MYKRQQLDSALADGILFHHLPGEQILTAAQLPQVVWLAHALTRCAEVPDALRDLAEQMFGQACSKGLTVLRAQAEERMGVLAEAIGITRPDPCLLYTSGGQWRPGAGQLRR